MSVKLLYHFEIWLIAHISPFKISWNLMVRCLAAQLLEALSRAEMASILLAFGILWRAYRAHGKDFTGRNICRILIWWYIFFRAFINAMGVMAINDIPVSLNDIFHIQQYIMSNKYRVKLAYVNSRAKIKSFLSYLTTENGLDHMCSIQLPNAV